jgi:hypothetical protein
VGHQKSLSSHKSAVYPVRTLLDSHLSRVRKFDFDLAGAAEADFN